MQLIHYLITRFNIVQSWYFSCAKQGRGTTIQTEEWLNNRFMLFERYCFPSAKAQSASFTWLVLFNSETPEIYKKRIAHYQEEMPNFVPLYLKPYGDEVSLVKDYISSHCTADMLLTTRMDNDDMLHADYLSWIQQSATTTDHRVIFNYAEGYQYDVRRETLYRMFYPDNHYFSVLEPFQSDYHTCLGIDHSDLSVYGKYVELSANNRGGWIEVLHSQNVANHRHVLKPVWRYHREKFPRLSHSLFYYIAEYVRFRTDSRKRWLAHKIDKHIIQRIRKMFK
ncbi:MAG: glycosyltransferase [Paludibacteraceae bacterium]